MSADLLKDCREVEWFEDYEVGDEFAGNTVEFTQEQIIDFARQYDPQPFHIDPAAATASHFGGIIASGTHILAAAWGGLIRAGFLNGKAMGAGGIDDYKNLVPVRPGDSLTLYALVRETRSSTSRADRGYVSFDHRGENQNGNSVCTFRITQIIATRPS
ncbi:MAG: MaoC/PaaZ C-terminal domain-containing protein [Hyphomicrobiaceae bacterium]